MQNVDARPASQVNGRHLGLGILLTILGGVGWGFSGACAQFLMHGYGVDPRWIVCVRVLAAGVVFLAVAAVADRRHLVEAATSPRALLRMAGYSLGGLTLCMFCYLNAIDASNAGTATVLQALNLLFVLAFVCIRGRRRPGLREGVGVALAFGGTVLIATGGDLSTLKLPAMGLVWGILNAIATAAMGIMPVRLIARWGNMVVNGVMFLISGVILLPFAHPWSGSPSFDAFGLLLMAYTVVIGTFGSFALYLAGVMRIGAMRATMLGTSEPVAATVSSVVFLGAVFTPTDLIGFVMILVMVFLVR